MFLIIIKKATMTFQPRIVTCNLCSSVLAIRDHETVCRICGTNFIQVRPIPRTFSSSALTVKSDMRDLSFIPNQFISNLLENVKIDLLKVLNTLRNNLEFFTTRFVPSRYCITLLNRKPLELALNTNLSFSGIYYIVNLQNKFRPIFYVGESSDIGERLKNHFETLRVGKHHSKFNSDQSINLQSDFTRYGSDVFYFGVLKQLPFTSRYSREEVEAQFIKKLNSYEAGYNAVPHQRIARKRHRSFNLRFRY